MNAPFLYVCVCVYLELWLSEKLLTDIENYAIFQYDEKIVI